MKELSSEEVGALFTAPDGAYAFARWGRPLVPVVFGLEEESLGLIKGAIEAVAGVARLEVAETDPELGANLMLFFLRDWAELQDVPNLEKLLPGFDGLAARLEARDAAQYRAFRYDESGAIQACFSFLKLTAELTDEAARALAFTQALGAVLTWSAGGLKRLDPLARLDDGSVVLRPEIATLIAAAYDPVMPVCADDAAHAYRLAARLAVARAQG